MSWEQSPVVEEDQKKVTTGRGGKENKKEKMKRSEELRSRFGEAFLPFIHQLESMEKERTLRKRKGKNKIKTTNKNNDTTEL